MIRKLENCSGHIEAQTEHHTASTDHPTFCLDATGFGSHVWKRGVCRCLFTGQVFLCGSFFHIDKPFSHFRKHEIKLSVMRIVRWWLPCSSTRMPESIYLIWTWFVMEQTMHLDHPECVSILVRRVKRVSKWRERMGSRNSLNSYLDNT